MNNAYYVPIPAVSFLGSVRCMSHTTIFSGTCIYYLQFKDERIKRPRLSDLPNVTQLVGIAGIGT